MRIGRARWAGRRLRRTLLARALVVLVVGAVFGGSSLFDRSEPALTRATATTAGACTVTAGSLVVDGRTRTYRLCVPTHSRGPVPLVLALHGLTGSGSQLLRQTGLTSVSSSGIGVVAPDSVAGAWNDGRLGENGPDDEHFVLALLRHLTWTGVADPARITVTGFSNGADFSLVLASRYPSVFAAVVTASGHLLRDNVEARPTQALPTFLVYGAADPIQPWAGRSARSRLRPALLSAPVTAQTFARANHATRTTETKQSGATSTVRTVRYESEAGGAPVELIEVAGVGHVWPRRTFDTTALVLRVASTYTSAASASTGLLAFGPLA